MEVEKQYCQGYLGYKARDRVTGFNGVITSMGFDLYGCVQAAITPTITVDDKTGKQEHQAGHWFDCNRLELLTEDRVIPLPDFPFVKPVREGKPASIKKRDDYTGADNARPAPR